VELHIDFDQVMLRYRDGLDISPENMGGVTLKILAEAHFDDLDP